MKRNIIFAGLLLLCLGHNVSYAAEREISSTVIIKNNSSFDILCKTYKGRLSQEQLLAPGDMFSTDSLTIEIKRSGLGSSLVSSWSEVPSESDLSKKLSVNDYQKFDTALYKGCIPVINIHSGLTGWNFTLSTTCPSKR